MDALGCVLAFATGVLQLGTREWCMATEEMPEKG